MIVVVRGGWERDGRGRVWREAKGESREGAMQVIVVVRGVGESDGSDGREGARGGTWV